MNKTATVQGESVEGLRAVVATLVEVSGGQVAFAKQLGWGQASVSRFLSGETGLSARKARQLAIAYPQLRKRLAAAIFEEESVST